MHGAHLNPVQWAWAEDTARVVSPQSSMRMCTVMCKFGLLHAGNHFECIALRCTQHVAAARCRIQQSQAGAQSIRTMFLVSQLIRYSQQ